MEIPLVSADLKRPLAISKCHSSKQMPVICFVAELFYHFEMMLTQDEIIESTK